MTRRIVLVVGLVGCLDFSSARLARAEDPAAITRFINLYCVACHNADDKAADLDLEAANPADILRQPALWEQVVRRLEARQMPPADAPRPRDRAFEPVLAFLTDTLDRAAAEHPTPGRTDTLRRLNRTEYQNAIRDLLALEIDSSAFLPADESSHGFDNVTVGDLSPTLLDRYITAAGKISRLALGGPGRTPGGDTIRVRADLTQEEHVEGLPLGTRGGTIVPYHFPMDGEYEVQLRLARDRNEQIEGLREPAEVDILLDRERVARLTVQPPRSERDHQTADEHLKVRVHATAGPHQLGATFVKQPSSLLETKRQPYQAHYNMHRHPRLTPALYQVSITGPYLPTGPGEPPSRRQIFGTEPRSSDEEADARRILGTLIRRAYRRPAADADLRKPLAFFHAARAEGSFDDGIELALSAILVNPNFLFRIERDPAGTASGSAYRVPDLALASRLSFFLWSSIPDDELLGLAERNELHEPGTLERQVRRLLADPRANNLETNFASQWLHLRNLDSITPDLRLFPDFDDNLRQSFRRETELLFGEVVHDDRSVLDLIRSDHTFLNERLARHYGIPHVQGSHFRRVSIAAGVPRGGLLRQGSILTVTSYATRTSPVVRGKWVLDNLLGTPPPPQPANIPALKDNTVSSSLSVRERLAEHRQNIACVGCHKLMDPPGFTLENFDAVGRWRSAEEGQPVDTSGGLPDGSEFAGVAGLEAGLLRRPEVVVGTITAKLLTFALGRGVDSTDAPAIREVVRQARAHDWRFSAIIVGVASSPPFQMRTAE